MKKINILFTSVGRRVVLLQLFKKALQQLNIEGAIIAADGSENAAARYVADIHITVPKIDDTAYIPTLLSVCQKYKVGIVIPLIDTELLCLAKHKKQFDDAGVTLLVSSLETIEICNNKRKTYDFLIGHGFNTPKILDAQTIINKPNPEYPFFIKPINGSSSINAFKINNDKELRFFLDYIPSAVLQEFIFGEEYTLDILVDFSGKVRCIVPRLRIAVRGGEISKGITVKNLDIIMEGKRLVESLVGVVGCITVQCFLTKNSEIKFIEINPRFGGGFPLAYEAGANYPLWILQMLLGQHPNIKIDGWQENVKMLRYDDAVYLRE